MMRNLPAGLRSASFLAAVVCLVSAQLVDAQEGVPASESVQVRELKAALKVAQEQADAEKRRANEAEEKRRSLTSSLAEAVRVSEEQMNSARDTELKLQALGVGLVDASEESLQQRLLKAVRDLDISRQEIDRQSKAIHRLSESFLKVLKSAGNLPAPLRSEAEGAIAAANDALVPSVAEKPDPVDLSEARVVSFEPGIGLVVFNAGRKLGLRVGTPVAVLRGDSPLYSALIVDVRDSLSGAVLQDRLSDAGDVAVGDGVRLLPEQNTL